MRTDQPERATRTAISLRSEATEWPRLRGFAEDFARRARLSVSDQGRLLVILDELFNNLIRHGYDLGQSSGTAEVVLSLENGSLRIELIDDGRPFDPLAAAPPNLNLPLAQRPIGGLGIHIVKSLVGKADYARKGERNSLTLYREIDTSGAKA